MQVQYLLTLLAERTLHASARCAELPLSWLLLALLATLFSPQLTTPDYKAAGAAAMTGRIPSSSGKANEAKVASPKKMNRQHSSSSSSSHSHSNESHGSDNNAVQELLQPRPVVVLW
jgi:hypothetical protein